MSKLYEIDYAGRPLTLEIGKMARQSHGSCTIRYGDTVVLVTACRAGEASVGLDFMPLTVNYTEMTYAAGKIPGGFFKREGRPSEKEVLSSRLIDRPLRPLFTDGYHHETQVIATVMSVDHDNNPDLAATIGASVALGISDIPFEGPIAAVRVGSLDGKLVCNPGLKEQKASEIDLLVAGTENAIIMVEGGARFASEDYLIEALGFAQESMKEIIELQKKIISELGVPKIEVETPQPDEELTSRVKQISEERLAKALRIPEKQERYAELLPEFEDKEKEIKHIFSDLKYDIMRQTVLGNKLRVDGRGPKDIREITCDVGLLPRTHGSALFTRGETQAMVVTTLGTSEDEQKIDALSGWEYKSFMLHYSVSVR
jgi:polyribonucleotide nucleotidyltransferase